MRVAMLPALLLLTTALGCMPPAAGEAAPVVACDPTRISPLPSLTCEEALAAAAPRLATIGSRRAVRATFAYGPWCAPNDRCPPFDPEVGSVLVEFADGAPPVVVDVRFEHGRVWSGEAHEVADWSPEERVDGTGFDR